LQRFQKEYQDKGLVIFSIGNMSRKKAVEDYVVRQGLRGEEPLFHVLMDGWKVYRKFGGRGAPNTFVVDRNGRVRFIHRDYYAGMERILKREIEALLAEES
jgi:hypothetical protein